MFQRIPFLGCAMLVACLCSVSLSAQTNGGYSINITNRAEVRAFYTNIYLSSVGVPLETSAFSQGTCYHGTNSSRFKEATLRRLNYYRALAGVSANIVIDPLAEPEFQAAALVIHLNSLSYAPPPSFACWSQM